MISMITGVDTQDAAAKRVGSSLVARGNGLQTSPMATRGNTLKAMGAQATAAATGNTATTASSADITSNDFLTLLVTEMKNQDPTTPTDPNAYIQQLVGVNSLQQLISINGELGSSSARATGSSVAGGATAPATNPLLAIGVATGAPTSSLYGS